MFWCIMRVPFKPSQCIKASFYILKTLNFPTTKGFRTKISVKLIYQYMGIFFNFSPTSNHVHPLQMDNCDSNSRLVVNEHGSGKFRLERVESLRGIRWFIEIKHLSHEFLYVVLHCGIYRKRRLRCRTYYITVFKVPILCHLLQVIFIQHVERNSWIVLGKDGNA